MKDKFFLIRDIVYLLLAAGWVVAFFLNRQTALEFMPLLLVVLFVNIDSRVAEIIKRLENKKDGAK